MSLLKMIRSGDGWSVAAQRMSVVVFGEQGGVIITHVPALLPTAYCRKLLVVEESPCGEGEPGP
jgi:hypothetical protein